jgi:polar amino acid transport system permease protein
MSLSTAQLGYNWQWKRVPKYIIAIKDGEASIGPLIRGLLITFKISGVSLIFAFLLGLVTALLRLSNSVVGRAIGRGYIEVIRNTPLLVQLFFIYFIVGPIFGLQRFFSAVLALSLFEGAYASEIFRAGIVSIHKGQWEAAYSLGLSGFDTYGKVILPQAIRRILPPLTSQAISLIKDSALVSLIALNDLTLEAKVVITDTFLTFEIWFVTAGIYLVITIILSTIVNLMEKKFRLQV